MLKKVQSEYFAYQEETVPRNILSSWSKYMGDHDYDTLKDLVLYLNDFCNKNNCYVYKGALANYAIEHKKSSRNIESSI